MTIIDLLVLLVIAGVLVHLFNRLVPMDPRFKTVVNVIVGLLLFLWVLETIGLIGPMHIGHVRKIC